MTLPKEAWHPDVRLLFDYWTSLSRPPRLPGRPNFDPCDVPELLSRLWLLDVQRDPLRFRYRLFGTHLATVWGYDYTGCWLDEVHPGFEAGHPSHDAFAEVVVSARPSWRRGPAHLTKLKDVATLERLCLPLAADGKTVDMVLGITIFYTSTEGEL